jgi:hypothetical protein
MAANTEREVFRIDWHSFDTTKWYEVALATRRDCSNYKNQKYYTTNPLKYIGKFVRYYYEGGDEGVSEIYFNDNGKENKIVLDYAGLTCFIEVDYKVL